MQLSTPEFMLEVREQTDSPLQMLCLILTVVIMVPVCEELVFRGLAYARLERSRVGKSGAVLITSVVFTLLHLQYQLIDMLLIFPLALLLGLVRYKTSNLVYCILLHATVNSVATIGLFMVT